MERKFWNVVLIACLPTLVGCILTGWIAHVQSYAEIQTSVAVLDQRITDDKELFINRFEEAEKRRTEQYEYLVRETNEIKDQVKMKRDIGMDFPPLEADGILLATRGARSKQDSIDYYIAKGDSLYTQLCLNLSCISLNLQ